MSETGTVIGVILVMAAITFALRALPFIAGRWLRRQPVARGLDDFLPLAIMVLLLLHATLAAARTDPLGPWPEAVAVALVAGLQWRSRNALLSILAGTCCYVLLRMAG